ncbi:MAG: TVP38/TMEM64 family protein [Spirochaetaceae bacterium]
MGPSDNEKDIGKPGRRAGGVAVLFSPGTLLAGAVFLGAVAAVVVINRVGPHDLFDAAGLKAFAADLGWTGPAAYVGILALTVVVSQLPGLPLAVGAGMLWGVLPGFLLSLCGGFLGSVVAYFIGRRLGRDAVYAFTGRRFSFKQGVVTRVAGIFIGITRLIPVLPFDMVSYAAGIAGIPFGVYAAATLLGMAPSTLLIVYLGSTMALGTAGALALSAVAAAAVIIVPYVLHKTGLVPLHHYIDRE